MRPIQWASVLAGIAIVHGAPAGPGDWNIVMNSETIDSCVSAMGQNSTVNGVFYLGHTDTWQQCQTLCGNLPECVSFDWHPNSGSFAGACYERITDYFEPKRSSGRVVGMRPGAKPGTAPACVQPPAPTPPPTRPSEIDCAFRALGMTVANRNLLGDPWKLSFVEDALQMAQCLTTPIELPRPAQPEPTAAARDEGAYYVSAAGGSDSNPGTAEKPFATLNHAQEAVRRDLAAGKTGLSVVVEPGSYYEELLFTPQDSGTAESPVVWTAADPTKPTVISGGVPLATDWAQQKMNNVTVLSSVVHNTDLDSIPALFVNGKRWKLARFPNGNPLVPKSGYIPAGQGLCPGMKTSVKAFSEPYNIQVVNKATKTVLSQGWARPVTDDVKTVWVDDATVTHDAGAFQNFEAYVNGTNSCYNTSLNLPFWQTCTCSCRSVTAGALGERPHTWAHPETAVIHMFHTAGWGGWDFQVDSFEPTSGGGTFSMTGGQQTGQSGPCGINGNLMFVDNVKEELDDPTEFFYDTKTRTLFVVPPDGMDMSHAEIVVPHRRRVVQFRGSDDNTFAEHITLKGFTFAHSEPTYLADYELPSGGDWTISRNGMVFLDGAEFITLQNNTFDQPGGNALFLSQHAWHTVVDQNTFLHAGDSAIALVGSTDLMNGTRPTYVAFTNLTNNLMYEVGLYGKQTAAVFKSMTYRTRIVNNVALNGPRSGINFNDAFMGGDLMEGNLLGGYVRETNDHASFNSWDRQAWFFEIDGVTRFEPEVTQITRNLILNKDYVYGSTNSDWCIDHDDASSYFYDDLNVLVWGAHKWRDGVNKSYVSNLYVSPPNSSGAQTWGIGWYVKNTANSSYLNNTFVNWDQRAQFGYVWGVPTPDSGFAVDYNRYYTPNNPATPFVAGKSKTLAEWQATCSCDTHSTISADMELPAVLAMAKDYLQLP